MDVREQIERLPRFSDDRTQDNQSGRFLERNSVLGIFNLYLGGDHDG